MSGIGSVGGDSFLVSMHYLPACQWRRYSWCWCWPSVEKGCKSDVGDDDADECPGSVWPVCFPGGLWSSLSFSPMVNGVWSLNSFGRRERWVRREMVASDDCLKWKSKPHRSHASFSRVHFFFFFFFHSFFIFESIELQWLMFYQSTNRSSVAELSWISFCTFLRI